MPDWIVDNSTLMLILAGVSLLTFVAGLVLVPMLIVRIPADYFERDEKAHKAIPSGHSHTREMLISIGRNLLGLILVCGGIMMLVLPGQGVLTILLGLMLMNFPGKYRLIRWIVQRPAVLSGINWMRRRRGKPELVFTAEAETSNTPAP